MISKRISDDLPLQMKTLNMDIPILMYFCSLRRLKLDHYKSHKAKRLPMKYDIIIDIKLFQTHILLQIFDIIQTDFALKNQVH